MVVYNTRRSTGMITPFGKYAKLRLLSLNLSIGLAYFGEQAFNNFFESSLL